MKNVITSDDILGKKAVDSDGQILGIVITVHIDTNEKKILGITIDQGFMKPDLYIGIDFVKQFGVDAVLLNEFPLSKLKGVKVFTESGKNLGNVINIKQKNNRIQSIIIGKLWGEKSEIGLSSIKHIGTSIVVKDNFISVVEPENRA